jgi:hypothetical protein
MSLKTLFGGLDATKLSLNTLSGFVVTAALLFLIDGFSPAHMTEELLTEPEGGAIVAFGLIIIVASTLLGLMVDSIFHTFGRRFARIFWVPLTDELTYRNELMKSLGLRPWEFEWVQSTGTGLAAETEKNLIRFTETAGNAAYAMFLLSPATAFFLSREYAQSNLMALIVAAFIAIGALTLLYTSAASLTKYEGRKTAAAQDEIHKLSSRQHIDKKKVRSAWTWALLWPMVLAGAAILLAVGLLFMPKPTEVKGMDVIAELQNGEIPTINLEATIVKGTPAVPGDVAKSLLVEINNTVTKRTNFEVVTSNGDCLSAEHLPEPPKWEVRVTLTNNENVKAGDEVCINALLSFGGASAAESLIVGDIGDGDWLFPIVVTDTKANKECLLAYVKVTISWVSKAPGE